MVLFVREIIDLEILKYFEGGRNVLGANILAAVMVVFFVICFEVVVLLILFRKKNKLATKIVKRLMKTQLIPYRRTMKEVDDELEKLLNE